MVIPKVGLFFAPSVLAVGMELVGQLFSGGLLRAGEG